MTTPRLSALACCAALALTAACANNEHRDRDRAPVGADWSDRALDHAATGQVDDLSFSLTLPIGMKLDVDDTDRKEWLADKDDYFSEPSVAVSVDVSPPGDLDAAVDDMMVGKEDVVVRRERVDHGFIVTYHSKNRGLLETRVWRLAGDKALTCSAGQATTGGVPSFDATRAWLERLCLSLRAG